MHKNLRHSIVAVTGLAAALALTACGSGSGSDKATGVKAPTPAAASSAPGGAPAATPAAGSQAPVGSVEGSWISMAVPSKPVVLTVKGKTAVVVEGATGLTCQGTSDGKTIDLKCPSGALHSKGTVISADTASLKVTWQEVGTETYQKSEPGKLPTGLPTALPKP